MPTFIQVTPSSVTTSGGSASITPNGSVEYSSASTVTINGVFSSAYEFYVLSHSGTSSIQDEGMSVQLSLSASPDTGNNFDRSLLYPGASIYSEATNQSSFPTWLRGGSKRSSSHMIVAGAAQATYTTFNNRAQSILSGANAAFYEVSATHRQSVAYDGIHFIAFNGGTVTGTISFYAVEE